MGTVIHFRGRPEPVITCTVCRDGLVIDIMIVAKIFQIDLHDYRAAMDDEGTYTATYEVDGVCHGIDELSKRIS